MIHQTQKLKTFLKSLYKVVVWDGQTIYCCLQGIKYFYSLVLRPVLSIFLLSAFICVMLCVSQISIWTPVNEQKSNITL